MKYLYRSLGIFVLVLSMSILARAQEIDGLVTDPSGAIVPNVTVSVKQVETGTVRTTQSGVSGLYHFSGLAIGTYDLKATATGFKTFTATGLVLNVAQTLRENVALTLGSESQTVTVEANVLQVQTETNEVSSLITGKQIEQLATNGRNVISLTTLGTGVSTTNPSFNGVTAQGSSFNLSFNGMRPDHNDWLLR